MSVNDLEELPQNGAANWLLRQWNDIKGNVKFWVVLFVAPFLSKTAIALTSGIPLWRRAALGVIFIILFGWAILASLIAKKRSVVLPPKISEDKTSTGLTLKTSVEVVHGYDEVYDRALTLLKTSEVSCRAAVYSSNLPLAPERFVDGLVNHLKTHPRVTYHITFIGNLSNIPQEFWTTVELRRKRMEDANVTHQFRMTFIDSKNPVGFDVLVIDENHCCIGFSPAAPTQPHTRRHAGLFFEQSPDMVRGMRSWLENLGPLLKEQAEARRMWNLRIRNRRATPEQ